MDGDWSVVSSPGQVFLLFSLISLFHRLGNTTEEDLTFLALTESPDTLLK